MVFIGKGDTGIWVSDRERDAFLTWFAENRAGSDDGNCSHVPFSQSQHRFCLDCFVPHGQVLRISKPELEAAVKDYWPNFVLLLHIVSNITKGEWLHGIKSREALAWRPKSFASSEKWNSNPSALK